MKLSHKIKARRVQAALQRAAYADRNYTRLRSSILQALHRQIHDYAKSSTAKVPAQKIKQWRADFERAQRGMIRFMVEHGWELAGEEVGHGKRAVGKNTRDQFVGKASIIVHDKDNFLTNADMSQIDHWIKSTADSAAQTSAKRLENIFKGAATEGQTPRDIATEIIAAGLTQSEARASMLAHTGAIWSYNQGALQRYKDADVAVVEWLTADDDLTCPFCAEMNGKRIETGDSFFSAGDKLQVDEIVLKIPSGARGFDVNHPPLHPNCRCTIVPIFDENA